MKFLFQLIGFLVVILLLLCAILFYMDTKGLLSGDLAAVVHALHELYTQARDTIRSFLQNSGIADDAANLLDEGAERLRDATATPDLAAAPTPTGAPTQKPAVIIEVTTPAP